MPILLAPGDVVMVMGLASCPRYNYQAGVVLNTKGAAEGRVPVLLLHGQRRRLSVRRRHLRVLGMPGSSEDARRRRAVLAESCAAERASVLTRVVWERQLELRVAAPFLKCVLHDESGEGLCQNIASFFDARSTLALTTGFANGHVVPNWICVKPASCDGGFQWRPIHGNGPQVVWGAADVKDGIVRIDCAVVDIGLGRFVVAGGCADHPQRVHGNFFRSAFVYDAMAHAAAPLPDMPIARHGCGGACLNVDGSRRVFVFGGNYVHSSTNIGTEQCHVLDLEQEAWCTLGSFNPQIYPIGVDVFADPVAFMPFAAVGGRLVAIVQGKLWALDPLRPGGVGWRRAWPDEPSGLGVSAQACVSWGGQHLIVSQGRGASDASVGKPACHVYAVTFCHPPGVLYAKGLPQILEYVRWSDLGPVDSAVAPSGRVGGDLAVVHDRLYICGGADERVGRCHDTVARWGGTRAALQASSPAFNPSHEFAFSLAGAQTVDVEVHSAEKYEPAVRGVHSTEMQRLLPLDIVCGASTSAPLEEAEGAVGDTDPCGHCLAVMVTSMQNSAVAASVQVRRLRSTQGGGWEASAPESLLSAGLSLVLIDQRLLVIMGVAGSSTCSQSANWSVVAGLKMPVAMHAHSAITVPLLPELPGEE